MQFSYWEYICTVTKSLQFCVNINVQIQHMACYCFFINHRRHLKCQQKKEIYLAVILQNGEKTFSPFLSFSCCSYSQALCCSDNFVAEIFDLFLLKYLSLQSYSTLRFNCFFFSISHASIFEIKSCLWDPLVGQRNLSGHVY